MQCSLETYFPLFFQITYFSIYHLFYIGTLMLGWFKKKLKKEEEREREEEILENTSSESINELPITETVEEVALETPAIDESVSDTIPEPAEITVEEPEVLVEDKQEAENKKGQVIEVDHSVEPELIPRPTTTQAVDKEEQKKPSLFKKLADRLSKSRETFTYKLDTLFLGKKEIDNDLFDDLEEILITADLGVAITEEVLDYARRKVKRNELSDPLALRDVLKNKIATFIEKAQEDAALVMPESGPFIIMVVGVNGVGKTTSIGKIARKFVRSGNKVMLVAGDTFRAAAVSQLKIWGERNEVEVFSQNEGADPSSVAFDAIAKAQANNFDVVLIDTAGRLHTQANLMEELKKIKRVIGKKCESAPHEVMLVIDATTGQNGISQAKIFNEAVNITGITLTKLDGTAKGGIVANISKELGTPIRFIGVGEQIEDLRDFDHNEFIEALFQTKEN